MQSNVKLTTTKLYEDAETDGVAVSREYLLKSMSERLRIDPKRDQNYEGSANVIVNPDTLALQKAEPVIHLPDFERPIFRPSESFHPLQEWEGEVTSVGEDTFTASLVDLTSGSDRATEEADFPIDDLADSDLSLLKLGAIFRWSIGYSRRRSGTKRRISHIVFRRLPQWTKTEIEQAKSAAAELSQSIDWD